MAGSGLGKRSFQFLLDTLLEGSSHEGDSGTGLILFFIFFSSLQYLQLKYPSQVQTY